MRPKITLSSTKTTVWYTERRCSRVCAVVIRDRRAPITRPATITEVTPETWNVSPDRQRKPPRQRADRHRIGAGQDRAQDQRRARRQGRHRHAHRGDRGRRGQHQPYGQHRHRTPDGPQVAPGQFLAGRIQKRWQHHQAHHVGRHVDRGRPRQHAHGQAGHHQQGRGGNPQPPGEGRHDGGQRDQQHHDLNSAHAGPPLRSDGRSRPDFLGGPQDPAQREGTQAARTRSSWVPRGSQLQNDPGLAARRTALVLHCPGQPRSARGTTARSENSKSFYAERTVVSAPGPRVCWPFVCQNPG
jgi:hypothetical protein